MRHHTAAAEATARDGWDVAERLDAAADAVVDMAMGRYAGKEREQFREQVQDKVDALIDECRSYYKEVFGILMEGGNGGK